ncbi:MAG: aquaporin [Lentimicrobium sp.]|nr:aquaporin [Lentimicrobium sp.]
MIKKLLTSFHKNWKIYLIEAWALGMFMVSASLFVIIIEHPSFPIRHLIPAAILRRLLIGLAMGITAVLLIYSGWGKRSGAHMNPAVTLTFLTLNRISGVDAFWYITFQFLGGYLGVLIFRWTLFNYISNPTVNYIITVPGQQGLWVALILEFLLSFIVILTVLFSSNSIKAAPYTGYFVGLLLVLFIAFEAPFSGMSINPARTFSSALAANQWNGWWLYFIGPVSGMLFGGYLYRANFRSKNNGNCTTMNMHLSGYKYDCVTYEVTGPKHLLLKETNKTGK